MRKPRRSCILVGTVQTSAALPAHALPAGSKDLYLIRAAWESIQQEAGPDLGGEQHAHKRLAQIYNWFTEGLDTPDLQEAKTLLEELA